VTDDTDTATMEQVRAVYDYLSEQRFLTTKTVWAFNPEEGCGIPPLPDSALRGITLEDAEYRRYCLGLKSRGFEICLHGASAGNNRRDRQEMALDIMRKEFGSPGTYICHAKNADNPYWEEQTTRLWPFNILLGRFSQHRCSGEDPASPYYWADLCYTCVEHIRLFRTRSTDTLAVNPSMPYYDPRKPLVRSWFSATKRALRDCATPRALEALRRGNGLTVLYQYMHRYADARTLRLSDDLTDAVQRILAAGDVLVAPVSTIMRRLRLLQGVFLCTDGTGHWAVNITEEDAPALQLAGAGAERLRLPDIPAGAVVRLDLPRGTKLQGRRVVRLDRRGAASHRIPAGLLRVNCGDAAAAAGNAGLLPPMSWRFVPQWSVAHRPLSVLSRCEEYRLVAGQARIILREMLLRGRSLSTHEYLKGENPLERHENW
jgi:hypothetical protein